MIGKISGILDYRALDHVLIDTGGVGYLVYCSDRTLSAMPRPGGPVTLYTDLLVREDLLQLTGFLTLAEREWYRLLTSVQGVGSRAALAVLGTLGTEGIARALALGDATAIRAAPGIGPKIAQRLMLELRDKAPSMMALGAQGARPAMVAQTGGEEVIEATAPAEAVSTVVSHASAQADALSALLNLGYGRGEAAAAVAQISSDAPDLDAAALIRASLRHLAPKG